MAEVLFVEPELRTDKLGILYLSAVLKEAGHHVDLVMDTGGMVVEGTIAATRPDFVMYSVFTGNHGWYFERNRELKRRFEFTSVFGGTHMTFFPEDGVNDPDVDYVVRGPGENAVVSIVEGRGDPAPAVVMGTVPDVGALPPPDRSILYQYPQFGQARMKRFITCRDCMWSCTYCFNHLYHRIFKDQKRAFYQKITPEQAIDEIRQVRDEWGLELAYFNDDDFARDHAWLAEFCERFKRELGLQFCGSVRASSLTESVVQMMAGAGCTFMNIALESAVPETQRILRRGPVTNDDILNACGWFRKYGIKVRLQNMVGLPLDDPLEDALETLHFNIQAGPTDSWAAIFQPFPKTDAWRRAFEMGLIDEETECMTFFDDTVLAFPEPTRERINRLAKWWYFAAKWGLPTETVRELIEIPLTADQKAALQGHRWKEAAGVLYGL